MAREKSSAPAHTTEKPQTAVCADCGGEYPRREMVELHEDNHDNLTYFHGDELCRTCANDAGVEY